jgi:signal transduction histidine kinase
LEWSQSIEMTGTIANLSLADSREAARFTRGLVVGLLDTVETVLVVAERGGRIVLMNARARESLHIEASAEPEINLFTELLKTDPKQIFRDIESGKHEVHLEVMHGGEKFLANVQWIPEPDRVVVQF